MHYYAQILSAILATYEKYGYKFLVFEGNKDKDVEQQYIQELLAYKIEGLIVLSHTIPSKELASYNIPTVTIEREDQYTCSVNTDNYMGAVQATSLLCKNNCDILFHLNQNLSKTTPGYQRILGFLDICKEYGRPYQLILDSFGRNHEENQKRFSQILEELDENYQGKKKGIFVSNDTHANILLNLIIRKFGTLPEEYRIVGFDDSPIASSAIIPISTVGQQIGIIANQAMELLVMQMNERKKRGPVPLTEPIHQVVTPILKRRETTD